MFILSRTHTTDEITEKEIGTLGSGLQITIN